MGSPCGWIYDYQTLITGMIAGFAAYLTVRGIREQITAEDQRLKSKLRSEREARVAVYIAAVNAFFYQIHAFFTQVHIPQNDLNQNVDIRMSRYEWDMLPKELPTILNDWEYFVHLPAKDIKECVKVKGILDGSLETIQGLILVTKESEDTFSVYLKTLKAVESDLMHRDKQIRNVINNFESLKK